MKIPKEAKRVFKGILFDTYHWEQEMFDGSFKTFEMLRRKPSVDVIVEVGGKILILEQEQPAKPPFISPAGGRVDKGETPLEAAKRELLEETGHEAEKFVELAKFDGYYKIKFPETVFVARNCKKVVEKNLDSGEKIKTRLIEFDEFLNLCRNPKFVAPMGLRFMMYEALLDEKKYQEFKNKVLGE